LLVLINTFLPNPLQFISYQSPNTGNRNFQLLEAERNNIKKRDPESVFKQKEREKKI